MSEQSFERAPEWDTADRMRKALRHAGVGMQDMADYLDVSRTSVSAWVNGRVRPSTRTLRVWALRCGVPFGWLADGVPERAKVPGVSGNLRFKTDLGLAA